jgi:hypothetical protein
MIREVPPYLARLGGHGATRPTSRDWDRGMDRLPA